MNRPAEPLTLERQLRALGYDVPEEPAGQTGDASLAAWRAEVLRGAEGHPRSDGGTTWVASGRSGASVAVFDDAYGTTHRIVPFLVVEATSTVVYRGVDVGAGVDATGSGALELSILGAGPSGEAVSLSLWTPHMAAWAAATVPGGMLEVAIGAVGADVAFVDAPGVPFTPLGPDGFARIRGDVTGHLMRHNDVTRRPFETAVVVCGGVAVTVAVDPSALRRPFAVGDIVESTVRLAGPVLRHAV